MRITVSSDNISGTVSAPGSKSYSQRYILMAAMGSTPLAIHGIHFSEDEQVALGIARSTGTVFNFEGDTVTATPSFSCPRFVDVGESATSYRLALGMLAARGCRTEFVGKPSLARRPMKELLTSLAGRGARFETKEDGFVVMDASGITPGDVETDQTESSQFVSALLLFLAFSQQQGGTLRTRGRHSSEGYVNMTTSCLRSLGYNVNRGDDTFTVSRSDTPPPKDLYIERDYSSAAFFLVLGVLSSNEGISLEGLPDNSLQGDAAIIDLLKNSTEGISMMFVDNRIVAKALRSYVMHIEIDANSTPDLAPPVSVLGIFSGEGITIRNPARLRIKESDRYGEIIRLARSFGARVEEGEDYLDIKAGQEILNPGKLSFDDHRMIMSAIIAGLVSGYEIEYENVEKINKSYPSFLTDLKKVGAVIKMENVL